VSQKCFQTGLQCSDGVRGLLSRDELLLHDCGAESHCCSPQSRPIVSRESFWSDRPRASDQKVRNRLNSLKFQRKHQICECELFVSQEQEQKDHKKSESLVESRKERSAWRVWLWKIHPNSAHS